MKMKLIAIAVVLGLVLTGLTYFVELNYSSSIQTSLHDVYNIEIYSTTKEYSGNVLFATVIQTTNRGFFFSYYVAMNPGGATTKYTFSPLAFIIDFLILFAICFSILFVSDFLSEHKKEKNRIMKQELRYGRRKIKRR
jgi:hypothetical protein